MYKHENGSRLVSAERNDYGHSVVALESLERSGRWLLDRRRTALVHLFVDVGLSLSERQEFGPGVGVEVSLITTTVQF